MQEQTFLRCQAILFDMDGTLVDSSPVIDRAWRWWTARHSIALEPILAVQQGRPNREVLQEFGPHLDIDQETALFLRFEEEDLDGLVAIPGANEAVKSAQSGKWGIVTSANRNLAELRLKKTGFPIPDVFVSADVIQRGKPDPECYLLGAAALHVNPKDCVVFEDAIAGVKAARAAEMTVVGMMTNLSEADLQAHISIPDFRSVKIHAIEHGQFSIEVRRPPNP